MEHFYDVEFVRDDNIRGKLYRYHSFEEYAIGDTVVCPIGVNGKLQSGIVRAEAKWGGMRVKEIICRYGDRKIPSLRNARDLGGILYDQKHLIAYGNYCRGETTDIDLSELGFSTVIDFSGKKIDNGVETISFPPIVEWNEDDLTSGRFLEKMREGFLKKELIGEAMAAIAKAKGYVYISCDEGVGSVDVLTAIILILADVKSPGVARDFYLSPAVKGKVSAAAYQKMFDELIDGFGDRERYYYYLKLPEKVLCPIAIRTWKIEFDV